MDAEQIADQLASQLQGASKGLHLVLCHVLEAAGGQVSISVADLERDALRLPPRLEVVPVAGQLLFGFIVHKGRRLTCF
jgi:hypothetical protein